METGTKVDWYWNYLTGKFGLPWRHETVPEGWKNANSDDVLPDPVPAAGPDLVPAADPVPALVERLRVWGAMHNGTLFDEAADALEAQAREIAAWKVKCETVWDIQELVKAQAEIERQKDRADHNFQTHQDDLRLIDTQSAEIERCEEEIKDLFEQRTRLREALEEIVEQCRIGLSHARINSVARAALTHEN